MTTPIHTRPFCLADAKAGAPYCCRDGSAVQVFKWDCRGRAVLAGIVSAWDGDHSALWSDGGDEVDFTEYDLVMLPLGYIDGKPVFVGDRLEQRDRHNETWIARDVQPNALSDRKSVV